MEISDDGNKRIIIESTISFTFSEYYNKKPFLLWFKDTIKRDCNATKAKETLCSHKCTHH